MTRQQKWVLIAAILGSGMVFADGSIVTVAIPRMREGLEASLLDMQWVSNSYTLALSSLLLLGGAGGDRYGLRRVFALGIVVFALASGGCALATSAPIMITARALQGLGGAMLTPCSLARIGAHFPASGRGRAIGVWAATTSIGAAGGPLLGGWLIDHAAWQSIFLINLPIAAIAVVVLFTEVEDLPRQSEARMDWTGGLLAFAGLGVLTAGLTLWGQAADMQRVALAAITAGVILLAGFLYYEARAVAPMLPPRYLIDRRGGGINALTFLLYYALSGAIFFLPTTLIQARNWQAEKAGSIFLAFTLVLALCSRYGGSFADRAGARWPLTIGPLVSAAGFALLGPAVVSGDFWRAVVPCMALLGLGMGIAVAPLSSAVMNAAPEGQTGVASAVNNAVARVAGLFAVASLGGVANFGFAHALNAYDLGADLQSQLLAGGFGAAPEHLGALGREASATANVAGFTTLAMVCAAFAALAGLTAYVTLRGPVQGTQLPR